MESYFKAIKKYKGPVEVISGVVTILAGLSTLLIKVFESKYTVAIVCVGLFILINRFWKTKARKTPFDNQAERQQNIKNVLLIRVFSYSLLIFPLYVAINLFVIEKHSCKLSNNLGVIITNFENLGDDDFSYKLYTFLQDRLQEIDTISVVRTGHFIDVGKAHYIDSIKYVYEYSCLNKGILVFGKRNMQLFDCSIYLNSLANLSRTTDVARSNDIIFLQNPDILNFSIDNQSKIVGEFILGLIYYNQSEYSNSEVTFKRSLSLVSSERNKFKSYCYLFIGNSHHMKSDFSKAIEEYNKGIELDSMNAYLHFNVAASLLRKGDSIDASKEFVKAEMLNKRLLNPIKDYGRDIATNLPSLTKAENIPVVKNSTKAVKDTPVKRNNSPVGIPSGFSIIFNGTKQGIVNEKGDTLARCIYDAVDPNIFMYKGIKFFIVRNERGYGAINVKGEIELPVKYPSPANVQSLLKGIVDLQNSDPNSISYE